MGRFTVVLRPRNRDDCHSSASQRYESTMMTDGQLADFRPIHVEFIKSEYVVKTMTSSDVAAID